MTDNVLTLTSKPKPQSEAKNISLPTPKMVLSGKVKSMFKFASIENKLGYYFSIEVDFAPNKNRNSNKAVFVLKLDNKVLSQFYKDLGIKSEEGINVERIYGKSIMANVAEVSLSANIDNDGFQIIEGEGILLEYNFIEDS